MQTAVSAAAGSNGSASLASPAAAPDQVERKPAADKSVTARIGESVKLVAAAYGIGFAVIMVHTIRLNGPVIEALQFQNIIAGLPVWAVLFGGIWIWPALSGAIVRESKGKKSFGRSNAFFFFLIAAMLWPMYAFFKFFLGRVVLERTLIRSEEVFLLFVTIFLMMLSMLYSAYQTAGQLQVKAMLRLAATYSGLAVLIVGYAIFGYPIVPQSFGGGRPQQVELYFKEKDEAATFNDSASRGPQPELSRYVYLYYRTTSFLLVSKAKGQPLIEVPMDQVRSIVWLDSRAE